MMARIADIMPVTPVPLVAATLLSFGETAVTMANVLERLDEHVDLLAQRGAGIVPHGTTARMLFDRAWRTLSMRKLTVREGEYLIILPHQRPLLDFYANSVRHLIPTREPRSSWDQSETRIIRFPGCGTRDGQLREVPPVFTGPVARFRARSAVFSSCSMAVPRPRSRSVLAPTTSNVAAHRMAAREWRSAATAAPRSATAPRGIEYQGDMHSSVTNLDSDPVPISRPMGRFVADFVDADRLSGPRLRVADLLVHEGRSGRLRSEKQARRGRGEPPRDHVVGPLRPGLLKQVPQPSLHVTQLGGSF